MKIKSVLLPQCTQLRFPPDVKNRSDFFAMLYPGKVLAGKVLRLVSPRMVVLDFGGITIQAKIHNKKAFFLTGQQILLRVEKLSPQVLMKVTGSEAFQNIKLGNLLSLFFSSNQLLAEELKLLEKILLDNYGWLQSFLNEKDLPQKILQQISRLFYTQQNDKLFFKHFPAGMGLFFGSLADRAWNSSRKKALSMGRHENMQWLLLKLRDEILYINELCTNRVDAYTLEKSRKIMKAIELVLRQIKGSKLFSILNREDDRTCLFQIPFILEKPETALLAITRDGKGGKKGSKQGYCIQIMLDTEILGRLSFYLQFSGMNLLIRIESDRKEIHQIIEQKIPDLALRLENLSFKVENICCLYKQGNSNNDFSKSLLQKTTVQQYSLFNLTI